MRNRKSGYGFCPNDEACPVEFTLDVIGGKWKGVLLYHLMNGPIQRISPNLPGNYPTDADTAASRTGGGWRRSSRGVPPGPSEGGVLLNGIWQNLNSDHYPNEGMGRNL